MKVKCIGGPADGTIIEVDGDYYKDGDMVRVPAKITFEISSFEDDLAAFREGRTPESMVIPYYHYIFKTMCHINNRSKSTIPFLIPEKWSYWEAMIYLFRSHNG